MNPRYPIMAALLAASLGTVSLGTSHAVPPRQPAVKAATPADGAPPVATVPTCPPDAKQKDPLNLLTNVVYCDPQPKADIGERLALFLLSIDDKGPLFVKKSILADESMRKAVADKAKEWPAATAAKNPAAVAELYFVLGLVRGSDGDVVPAWVGANTVLKQTIKNGGAWRDPYATQPEGLITALVKKWRDADANEGKISWTGGGPNQSFANQVVDFLDEAAKAAHAVLADQRTQSAIRLSIGENENAPVVPVGPGGGALPAAAQFTYQDHYQAGGVGGHVSGPGDSVKAPYYMKLETLTEPTGELKTYVAVYDHSENPCYIRRVPISSLGENTISHGAGRWSLVVDIKGQEGGNLSITLRRPNDKEGAEGIKTTANDLAAARFQQAVDKNVSVTVGDQSFLVLAQGGGKYGSHLFFNKSLLAAPGASWNQLAPSHAAVTSKVGPDGIFVPMPGKPSIGNVGGKDYHFVIEGGKWVVKEGKGDPVPTITAAAAPTDAARVQQAAAADGWVADDAAMAGLSAETKTAGYQILRRIGTESKQVEYNIITPAGFIKNNARSFAGVTDLRGVGHYFAWKRGDVITYQDLLKKSMVKDEAGADREDFDIVAHVRGGVLASVLNTVDGRNRTMKDFDVLADGLKTYIGFSAADAEKAVANAKAKTSGAEYLINEAKTGSVIIQIPPTQTHRVFPDSTSSPQDVGNPQTQGSGTAMNVSASEGTDVPFQPTIDIGGGPAFTKITRIKMDVEDPAKATAALYRKGEESATDARWYLYLKYREGSGEQIRRTGELLVFSRVSGDSRMDFPTAAVSVKGQTAYGGSIDPKTVSVSLVVGSTRARGAWTLHKVPAAQVGPSNCVGPVVWWGLSESEAYDAGCKKGKLE